MKKLSVCVLLIFICFAFAGCESINKMLSKDESVFELYNQGGDITLQCGEKLDYTIKLTKQTEDFLPESIETVCEDEGVARITYRFILWDSELHYYIEGVSSGETYIYFKTRDGVLQTEKVKVTVSDTMVSNTSQVPLQSSVELIGGIAVKMGETSNRFSVSLAELNGFSKDDIEIVSTDTSVVVVLCDYLSSNECVFFTVTGVAPGEAYIYLRSKDGKVTSNKVKVEVLPNATQEVINDTTIETVSTSQITVETTTESVSVQESTTETAVPSASETTVITTSETTTNEATTKMSLTDNTTVYVSPSGTKYHYKQTCAGKNAQAVSYGSIKDEKQPCKKCVHD